jgi:hypothetical protein
MAAHTPLIWKKRHTSWEWPQKRLVWRYGIIGSCSHHKPALCHMRSIAWARGDEECQWWMLAENNHKKINEVRVLKMNACTKLEMTLNNMSLPLQRLPDKTVTHGHPLIMITYRPFCQGPTGSFCKGDSMILAECPSILLPWHLLLHSHGHKPWHRREVVRPGCHTDWWKESTRHITVHMCLQRAKAEEVWISRDIEGGWQGQRRGWGQRRSNIENHEGRVAGAEKGVRAKDGDFETENWGWLSDGPARKVIIVHTKYYQCIINAVCIVIHQTVLSMWLMRQHDMVKVASKSRWGLF